MPTSEICILDYREGGATITKQSHLGLGCQQVIFTHWLLFLIFTSSTTVNPPFTPSTSSLRYPSPEMSTLFLFQREVQSRTPQTLSQTTMLSFPTSVPLFSAFRCILLQALSTLLAEPFPSSKQTCSNLNLHLPCGHTQLCHPLWTLCTKTVHDFADANNKDPPETPYRNCQWLFRC